MRVCLSVCVPTLPVVCVQTPVSWEKVSVKPVEGPDGKTTVPPEVIDSMKRNKVGLKGERGGWSELVGVGVSWWGLE